MKILYAVTIIAILISLIKDKHKTELAIKSGMTKLGKVVPPFLTVIMGVSVVLYLIPSNVISKYIGSEHSVIGASIASLIGSITMIPGPIVYPLCAILRGEGVSYPILAAFSTTLMMVGVLTFPMERAYYGAKLAILRNLISFVIAMAVAFIFIFLGEYI